MNPQDAARQLVERALLWAKSRAHLRRAYDSKSATEKEVEKAKQQHIVDADELEKAVLRFEASLPKMKSKGPKKPIPWQTIFGAISAAGKIAEQAMQKGPGRILDTEGYTVKK